jgi:hypothetical protein
MCINLLHRSERLSVSSDSGDLSKAQEGLQVPQILELVPPLGRQARALLGCDQHCPWNQGRRCRELLEDRVRFQPGRSSDHHHHPGSAALDEVEKQQRFTILAWSMLLL